MSGNSHNHFPKLSESLPRRVEAVIAAKVGLTLPWNVRQAHFFQESYESCNSCAIPVWWESISLFITSLGHDGKNVNWKRQGRIIKYTHTYTCVSSINEPHFCKTTQELDGTGIIISGMGQDRNCVMGLGWDRSNLWEYNGTRVNIHFHVTCSLL